MPDSKNSHSGMHSASQFSILHVEDNEVVASVVKETLECEGWIVETCDDGTRALERIASDAHYDLLLLDNDLPGINGIEITRRTRSMAHRQQTPIVLLSAEPIERQALKVGANAALHKPKEIVLVADTISRLLMIQKTNSVDTSGQG